MKVILLGFTFGILAALFHGNVKARAESGIASYYHEGKWTASGERFRPDGITCAHRSQPFGAILRVTLRRRFIECRCNDRGPFVKGRIIDLSLGAARELGLSGIARVTVERVR